MHFLHIHAKHWFCSAVNNDLISENDATQFLLMYLLKLSGKQLI